MKYTIYLILFIAYSIIIFQINNYLVITGLFTLNIILSSILHINKFLNNIFKFLPFTIFIILINIIFLDIYTSILIGYKLILVFSITYIFSKIFTPLILSDAISKLLYPLKIFKYDCRDLSLTITIALSFIPILMDHAINIKYSLLSKNFEFNLKNLITKPHIFVLTYIKGIFITIDDMEKCLISKSFN